MVSRFIMSLFYALHCLLIQVIKGFTKYFKPKVVPLLTCLQLHRTNANNHNILKLLTCIIIEEVISFTMRKSYLVICLLVLGHDNQEKRQ